MDLFGADTGTASMVLVLLILNLIKGEGLHGPGRKRRMIRCVAKLGLCTNIPMQHTT
jgi:hypothetical protein